MAGQAMGAAAEAAAEAATEKMSADVKADLRQLHCTILNNMAVCLLKREKWDRVVAVASDVRQQEPPRCRVPTCRRHNACSSERGLITCLLNPWTAHHIAWLPARSASHPVFENTHSCVHGVYIVPKGPARQHQSPYA